jgi:sporulation protein YqfC
MKERITAFANALGVTEDIAGRAFMLTMIGSHSLMIENHKGIQAFDQGCIIIQAKPCNIQITGKGLDITFYSSDEIRICGQILNVQMAGRRMEA